MSDVVLLVVTDLLARSRLEGAAKEAGVEVAVARRLSSAPVAQPALVLIDLDVPGVVGELREWRTANDRVPVTGFVSHVDTETRNEAEALGIDVVTRGQAFNVARRLFADLAG